MDNIETTNNTTCPKCGHEDERISRVNFCPKCGIQLREITKPLFLGEVETNELANKVIDLLRPYDLSLTAASRVLYTSRNMLCDEHDKGIYPSNQA